MYLYGIEIEENLNVEVVLPCFNCTFMELKYRRERWSYTLLLCFNCTFMELKLMIELECELIFLRFNCTFMELKYTTVIWILFAEVALIVPLWN